MADHVVKQVRDAVIARVTGLPSTGARVHSYRVNPLDVIPELPALIVRTKSDTADAISIHSPMQYERGVDVTIFAYASALADLDDVLDAVRLQVEQAIGAAPLVVGGKNVLPVYAGSDMDEVEGERPAGELQMRFNVTVYHSSDAPDVISS